MRKTQIFIALSAIGFAGSVFATNGMNLEGYGPIATAMGGASMAYDNGNAAVMNNPATLGLAEDGSRLDVAIGMLGPDVGMAGGLASGGDSYLMPAIGWTRKNNGLTYGAAMFAQGGMGTEYAMGLDGSPERSELGVGRLIFPLAYNVNPDLVVGGSIDYVWAMLDLRMAMPLANMAMLITPTGGGNGTLGMALNNLAMGGMTTPVWTSVIVATTPVRPRVLALPASWVSLTRPVRPCRLAALITLKPPWVIWKPVLAALS